MTAAAKSPVEINDGVKAFTEFRNLYLNRGMMTGQVILKHSHWKDFRYDARTDSTGVQRSSLLSSAIAREVKTKPRGH